MKRCLFLSLLFFVVVNGFTTNRTWNGSSGPNWSTPGNWTPNGTPTVSDDLTININAAITIDVAPNLSSLLITANAIVIFRATNATALPLTRIFTPASTSSTTKGFQLDAGSTLTIETNIQNTGSANLSLRFGTGVFGLINGTLIFNGTLTGAGNPLTTIALTGTPNVQVNGILQFYDASDNISGATTTNLFFNSGSIMEILKNGGSFPAATWDPNSLAKASNSVGLNPPIFFNGATYGNLEWNCTVQDNYGLDCNATFNNVHFVSTGIKSFRVKSGSAAASYTMTINGNLDIDAGCFVELVNGTADPQPSSGKIVLKGNLNVDGTLTTNGGNFTTNQFELNGTANQNITINGFLFGVKMEFIMNGVGATLLTPVNLPGDNNATNADLQLLNGKIITTSTNILTMNSTATVSGGSNNSFVWGPMRKKGNANFIFPLGKGSIYAPIGITNGTGAGSDVFTAEYIRGNPQSTYGPSVVPAMDHVSFVEYWTLRQSTGSSSKFISLDVHLLSFCFDVNHTYVGRWNGTQWTNSPVTVTNMTSSGSYQMGTITTNGTLSLFNLADTALTLITELPFLSNPLPITLLSFDATKLSNTKASINWELASPGSPASRFEIQKADATRNFFPIALINGSVTDWSYNYIDNDLKDGINYYRLKMIDENGKIVYSRIVAVMNGVKGLLLTSLIPTVVSHDAQLTITSSTRQQIAILIVDMQGRIIQEEHHAVNSGNSSIQLSFDKLAAGVYHLAAVTGAGRTNTLNFIKQ